MLSAYWGFAIISLHLGFQWIVVVGMAKKIVARPSNFCEYILRSVSLLIAGYGVYAFFKRDIGSYLILANQFAFFDFALPVVPVGRHSVYGDFYQRRTLQFNLVQKYEKGQREADQSRGNYECL